MAVLPFKDKPLKSGMVVVCVREGRSTGGQTGRFRGD